MKKLFNLSVSRTLVVVLAIYVAAACDNRKEESSETATRNTLTVNNMAIYQLFPTQNMWTFIKLDTRNGQMWQVQYDITGENRFSCDLNRQPLVAKEQAIIGRFTLYPTQNIFNFILLDQMDGKMWQTQWSMKPEQRGIIPIE